MLRQQGLSGPQRLNCFVFSKILACSLMEKCNEGEITHALGSQIRGSRWHTDMKRVLGAIAVPAENTTENFECFIYPAVPKSGFEKVLEV